MSGALPMTTASMSCQSSSASSSARSAASRTRPAIDTSCAWRRACVWPMPTTAQRSAITRPPARRRGSAAGTGPRWRGRARGSPSPVEIARAASPMRVSPAAIIGFAASAPPDGLIVTPSPSPSASRRISSWWVNGACSSATSTRASPTPAFSAASVVDGERVRSRTPRRAARCGGRCRGSRPGLRDTSSRQSPAASTIAAAPSEIGGQSCVRSGDDHVRLGEQLVDFVVALELRVRVALRVAPRCAPPPRPCRARSCRPLEQRARLQRREADRVGPERRDV